MAVFEVYSEGPCALSVCTTLTERADVEQAANRERPTGIASRWEVSPEAFRTGEPNPHPCERAGHRRHWLLRC